MILIGALSIDAFIGVDLTDALIVDDEDDDVIAEETRLFGET